jgi:hypothetical protein
MEIRELAAFIVRAKQATYVGGGGKSAPSRPGSHDLAYAEGAWTYRDSYFGGTDFIGQEVVWHAGEPIWAMNYYGYIKRDDLIDATRAGQTIKSALTAMYNEGRFLGGFEWTGPFGRYSDSSIGEADHFHGREIIMCDGVEAYRLDYAGGLVRA